MKGKELCDAWLAKAREMDGDKIADASECWYAHGWYYYHLAQTFPDGSVGNIGPASCARGKGLVEQMERWDRWLEKRKQLW